MRALVHPSRKPKKPKFPNLKSAITVFPKLDLNNNLPSFILRFLQVWWYGALLQKESPNHRIHAKPANLKPPLQTNRFLSLSVRIDHLIWLLAISISLVSHKSHNPTLKIRSENSFKEYCSRDGWRPHRYLYKSSVERFPFRPGFGGRSKRWKNCWLSRVKTGRKKKKKAFRNPRIHRPHWKANLREGRCGSTPDRRRDWRRRTGCWWRVDRKMYSLHKAYFNSHGVFAWSDGTATQHGPQSHSISLSATNIYYAKAMKPIPSMVAWVTLAKRTQQFPGPKIQLKQHRKTMFIWRGMMFCVYIILCHPWWKQMRNEVQIGSWRQVMNRMMFVGFYFWCVFFTIFYNNLMLHFHLLSLGIFDAVGVCFFMNGEGSSKPNRRGKRGTMLCLKAVYGRGVVSAAWWSSMEISVQSLIWLYKTNNEDSHGRKTGIGRQEKTIACITIGNI